MTNLATFISEIMENKKDISIYTTSKHYKIIKRTFKEIVDEKPEYYNIANFFALYPLQKFAYEQRINLKIDDKTLENLSNFHDSYVGVIVHNDMKLQKESLEVTNEIIADIERMIEGIDISIWKKTINDFIGVKKCSKYYVATYLKKILYSIFESNYKEFDIYQDRLDDIKNGIDDSSYIAFHDIEYLFDIARESKHLKSTNINGADAYQKVEDAIQCLKKEPFFEHTFIIVSAVFYKKRESLVGEAIGKSRTYVKKRYSHGLKILETIFWGYCTK